MLNSEIVNEFRGQFRGRVIAPEDAGYEEARKVYNAMINRKPALIALFLYALLPIVRNTFTGIDSIDRATLDAARGMGMRERQILVKIALPLALPVVMGGVRTSTVISVGVATLAALIGAGGLGKFIFRGIAMVDMKTVMMGAVPAAMLALVLDAALAVVERRLVPRGLRVK